MIRIFYSSDILVRYFNTKYDILIVLHKIVVTSLLTHLGYCSHARSLRHIVDGISSINRSHASWRCDRMNDFPMTSPHSVNFQLRIQVLVNRLTTTSSNDQQDFMMENVGKSLVNLTLIVMTIYIWTCTSFAASCKPRFWANFLHSTTFPTDIDAWNFLPCGIDCNRNNPPVYP